jgi:uncharacterized protein YndB with AHSA1/START domain
MTVTTVEKDPVALTLTLTADYDASVERVWQVWADPRQLERWWGPPTWPATFVDHDLRPGGRASYYMTGPDGERAGGWWEFRSVDAPHALEFEDGFADEAGAPNTEMPTTITRVRLAESGGGTRMTVEATFPSSEAMERMVAMGMEEGITLAMGQIDAILAEATTSS